VKYLDLKNGGFAACKRPSPTKGSYWHSIKIWSL